MGHTVGDATRRSVEAVRRVSTRTSCTPISASEWEHIEVVLLENSEVEHVSSLILDHDSRFRAEVFRRDEAPLRGQNMPNPEGDEGAMKGAMQARGSWRPCGRGVELILAAEEQLGLEELVILYRSKRGCLVADTSLQALPDGLAQEYSLCAPLQHEATVHAEVCDPINSGSEAYEDDFEDDDSVDDSSASVLHRISEP
ncbi:unnamed protein product [Symbiodinium natans]|uniref:Uncharacterized protein n=1 Tax=Symbiodinium natans TaxID=878477 RepID=A0A812KW54_9DINO|nr:unnamed protein product [Symbiodinium natans]